MFKGLLNFGNTSTGGYYDNPGIGDGDYYNPGQLTDSFGNGLVQSNTGGNWGNITGMVGAGAGILQGLSGLTSAYSAYKGLQLAKEQFKYQKGLANRNLTNQAKIINNSYDNAAQASAGLIGGGSYDPTKDTQGSYGMTDPAIVERYAQEVKKKYVDGSPI